MWIYSRLILFVREQLQVIQQSSFHQRGASIEK